MAQQSEHLSSIFSVQPLDEFRVQEKRNPAWFEEGWHLPSVSDILLSVCTRAVDSIFCRTCSANSGPRAVGCRASGLCGFLWFCRDFRLSLCWWRFGGMDFRSNPSLRCNSLVYYLFRRPLLETISCFDVLRGRSDHFQPPWQLFPLASDDWFQPKSRLWSYWQDAMPGCNL